MEYNPNRQSENKLKIAVAVLGLLTIALGFLYFRERQNNRKIDEISSAHAQELLSANTKLDSIENQLNSKIIEIRKCHCISAHWRCNERSASKSRR